MQPYTSSAPDLSHQNPATSHAPSCLPPASIQKPDVEKHLCTLFGKALTGARCDTPSTEVLHQLLWSLATPPRLTTLRVNTLKYDRETVITMLKEILDKQYSNKSVPSPPILPHPALTDVIVIPSLGPRTDLIQQTKKVVVGLQCGLAVLRGADVFAPGVMGAPRDLAPGDCVSVLADVDGKCKRGLVGEYEGRTLFVGNGCAKLSRRDLFGAHATLSGIAIQMSEALYAAPSLNAELTDAIFLQNLPSIVASHVLNPQLGEAVLDMCAAPGGKTVHMAVLMKNQGRIVAFDKTSPKVAKLRETVQRFGLSCVQCFIFDATKALHDDGHLPSTAYPDSPPYPPGSFDRVLLDAPCSALGQRPQAVCHFKLKELLSYPPYQRMLIKQAVGLLKSGGTLVYSTCTYSPEENECQVEWMLRTFPQLQLVKQVPCIGLPGLPGHGLTKEQSEKVQRFWPTKFSEYLVQLGIYRADGDYRIKDIQSCESDLSYVQCDYSNSTVTRAVLQDTIGFFIAKFVKL